VPTSRKDLIKKFRSLGFSGPYSGGKHQFMAKGNLKIRVPNPHGAGDITDSLLHEILRQAEITKDEWNKA
jgi:predicted RNA binding protein YcfA (HicA-like mRNA interferase family)